MNEIKKKIDVKVEIKGRRPGDPDELVADATKAEKVLGWKATNGVEEIISSALKFH